MSEPSDDRPPDPLNRVLPYAPIDRAEPPGSLISGCLTSAILAWLAVMLLAVLGVQAADMRPQYLAVLLDGGLVVVGLALLGWTIHYIRRQWRTGNRRSWVIGLIIGLGVVALIFGFCGMAAMG